MYDPKVHIAPPNCESFYVAMGTVYFVMPNGGQEELRELFAKYGTGNSWRGIVCAVARCAWLDEADRIHKKKKESGKAYKKENICKHYGKDYSEALLKSFVADFKQFSIGKTNAQKIAAAWAALGKEK